MTTATKSNANAAHPIAVAFLPAKTGSSPTCKHAITVISLLTLPIRLRRAFTEKRAFGSNAGPRGPHSPFLSGWRCRNGAGDWRFELPRSGKTVLARNQKNGEMIGKFIWNGKKSLWRRRKEGRTISAKLGALPTTKFANAVFLFCELFPTTDNHQEMHCGCRLSSRREAIASSFSRCRHRGQPYRRRKKVSAA